MKKIATFLLFSMLCAVLWSGCGDDAKKALLGEASENTACGRYCLSCDMCKSDATGLTKTVLDVICSDTFAGTKTLCEEPCEQGDWLAGTINSVIPEKYELESLNIKETVTKAEATLETKCGEDPPWTPMGLEEGETFECVADIRTLTSSCVEYNMVIISGGDLDTACQRFCSMCVNCSVGAVSSVAEWCGKEGGLPCASLCDKWMKSYVETAEEKLANELDDVNTWKDMECTKFDDYGQEVMDGVTSETDFPGL